MGHPSGWPFFSTAIQVCRSALTFRTVIVAVTTYHGREALAALFYDHTTRLLPFVITCPPDTPNRPLGSKWNAALSAAVEVQGATAFMILGSDDFISMEWVQAVSAALDAGHHYITPTSCAAVEPATGRACLMTDRNRAGRAFGAGRVYSRHLVETVGMPHWTPTKEGGLDTDAHQRVMAYGFAEHPIDTQRPPVCDVKTADNLHPFDRLIRMWKATPIPFASALHMVTDDTYNAIVKL